MIEQPSQETTTQPLTNAERFAGFVGLTALLQVNASSLVEGAMEGSGKEAIEVPVAGIDFDRDGKLVAVRFRLSGLLSRILEEGGNPDSLEAWALSQQPTDREATFKADGTGYFPGAPDDDQLAELQQQSLNVRPGPFNM